MRTAIALGSNLGDRMEHLDRAILALRQLCVSTQPFLISRRYATAPVDCPPGSGEFINAAVEMTSRLQPTDLLCTLQAIELAMGRPHDRPANAPRPMDLDILYFGDTLIQLDNFTVPHPRITQRRFVLAPLADIRPDLILPGERQTVSELLSTLPPDPEICAL